MEIRLVFILICFFCHCQTYDLRKVCNFFLKTLDFIDGIFLTNNLQLEDYLDTSSSDSDLDFDENYEKKPEKLTELDIYERQLSNKTIIIHNYSKVNVPKWTEQTFKSIKLWDYFRTRHDTLPEDEQLDKIEIFNFSIALETLKMFGHLITKLHLNLSNADSNEAKAISNYVNEYCSESLVEITFDVAHGNPLKYWIMSFENVKRLTFGVKSLSNRKDIPKLNEMFPRLQTISLYLGAKSRDYFDCHFPHLNELIINELNSKKKSFDDSYIDNLLRENPQIRSVTVYKGRHSLLQKITEALHGLENLTIESFKDFSGYVLFENLSKLSLKQSLEVPRHLHAPKLQELEMAFSSEDLKSWTKFLKDHSKLKRLHLNYQFIYHDDFKQMTDTLPDLEEVSVSPYQNAYSGMKWTFPDVATVIKFLETHEKLKKFDIAMCNDYDKGMFQLKLENKWQIIEQNEGLSFRLNETQN